MADNLFPVSSAQSVPDFFADPAYDQASYEKKKLMEADFASKLPGIATRRGASQAQQEEALKALTSGAAKKPKFELFGGLSDNATEIGVGLANVVGGTARYIGNEIDSNAFRTVADRLAESTKRMQQSMNPQNRNIDAQIAERNAALKAKYGNDIPAGLEIENAFKDFAAKPLRSISNVIGSAVPTAIAAAATGGSSLPVQLGATALAGAASTAGDAAGQADQSIIDMPIAELRKLSAFQEYVKAGDSEAVARERVAQDASTTAGRIGAAIGTVAH
jgi:hypothetical protein